MARKTAEHGKWTVKWTSYVLSNIERQMVLALVKVSANSQRMGGNVYKPADEFNTRLL